MVEIPTRGYSGLEMGEMVHISERARNAAWWQLGETKPKVLWMT